MPGCSRFDGDYSRIIVPAEYRKRYDMEQRYRIYEAWKTSNPVEENNFLQPEDSLKYIAFISPNMIVRDVFTGEEIDNIYEPEDSVEANKFALYTVGNWLQACDFLLFNHGEIIVIYMGDYPKASQALFDYFAVHPELDERLLPLCVQELTKIFVDNCRRHAQFGPWRRWWGQEADSLGRIYNARLHSYDELNLR